MPLLGLLVSASAHAEPAAPTPSAPEEHWPEHHDDTPPPTGDGEPRPPDNVTAAEPEPDTSSPSAPLDPSSGTPADPQDGGSTDPPSDTPDAPADAPADAHADAPADAPADTPTHPDSEPADDVPTESPVEEPAERPVKRRRWRRAFSATPEETQDEDGEEESTLDATTPRQSTIPEWFIAADAATPRPASADDTTVSKRLTAKKKVHSVLPLPTVRVEPLVGLQIGARLAYAYRPEDKLKVLAMLSARVSLRNVHEYGVNFVLWDLLHLNERFRFGLNARYDPVFPYFGLDQKKSLKQIFARGEDSIYSEVTTIDSYFQYQQPITSYGPGTLRMLFGLNYAYDRVQAYPDTLLVDEQPQYLGDTHRVPGHTGLSWDSRDNVYSPRFGGLHDVVFAAAPPVGDRDAWGLIAVSFRWYRRLGLDEIIFATRIAVDGLYGDAPFVPLGQLYGFPSPDAYGGHTIGRGFLRRRYIGRFKGVWSSELRFEPIEFGLFKGKRKLALGFKGFVELGRVIQDSEPIFDDIHVSGGPGIYFIWDRFAVIRFDVGLSGEFVGFYLLTGHAF